MMLFSNLGNSMISVADDYVVGEGEVVFYEWPTEDELRAAFPGRQAAQEAAALALLASQARKERDLQITTICDAGMMMAQRALRLAITPEQTAYAEGKIAELDVFAELLLAVPQQSGFPQIITWPVAPTK